MLLVVSVFNRSLTFLSYTNRFLGKFARLIHNPCELHQVLWGLVTGTPFHLHILTHANLVFTLLDVIHIHFYSFFFLL